MTITEALAEIKLIGKKLDSKGDTILKNLTRFEHMPDVLGDSKSVLAQEMQSMSDLWARHIKIRSAISKANLTETIKINDDEMTISEWITWKREISAKELNMCTNIRNKLKMETDRAASNPQAYKDADQNNQFFKLICNLSYHQYVERSQYIQERLDKLDGLLSLKNATTIVEV